MGKLTWTHFGLMWLAGVAGFACSQGTPESVKVGTVQVELRSDLVLSETRDTSTALSTEENSDHSSQLTHPISDLKNGSQSRAYGAVNRHEFLPALLQESSTRESSAQERDTHASSWTLADKHQVRGGKGFGVAGMVSPGAVHPDDASHYVPAVALKPYSRSPEPLEPMAGIFKSRKPLVFHSGATGFANELPADAETSRMRPAFETQLKLSPIPETQVYLSSKPKTQVTLTPAKTRLDLMNGNRNLVRDRFEKLN